MKTKLSIQWIYWPILLFGIFGILALLRVLSDFYDPSWELNWQVELFMIFVIPFCLGIGVFLSWRLSPRIEKSNTTLESKGEPQ